MSKAGETVLRHSGADSGFTSYNVMVPLTRSAVVALSNRDDVPPWDLVGDIVALLNKERRPGAPKVAGPSVEDAAREILAAFQSGRVDRGRFGKDFSAFLTDAKREGAIARLRPLGAPTEAHVEESHERGGMEASTVRFAFGAAKLEVLMFRSVDGRVEEFLVYKR